MICVFDIDGTLVDSRTRHVVLLRRLLQAKGLSLSPGEADEYMAYKADGGNTKSFLTQKMALDESQAADISAAWVQAIEDDDLLALDTVYSDSIPILEQLQTQCRILFLSARKRGRALLSELSRLGLIGFASDTFVVDPAHAAKEKTAVLISLREQGNQEIMMIGDTEADHEAALAADVGGYFLHRGFRGPHFWERLGIHTELDLHDLPYRLSAGREEQKKI